eukprot:7385498-Prymnesium_polylepis.2
MAALQLESRHGGARADTQRSTHSRTHASMASGTVEQAWSTALDDIFASADSLQLKRAGCKATADDEEPTQTNLDELRAECKEVVLMARAALDIPMCTKLGTPNRTTAVSQGTPRRVTASQTKSSPSEQHPRKASLQAGSVLSERPADVPPRPHIPYRARPCPVP